MECSACKSKDLYLDEAAGQFTCTSCGLVLEENTIVSSIEFQETGDRSHVIGRHVSYTAAMSNTGGLYSSGFGGGNSRENTLAKAKIRIKAVADSVGNLISTDIDVVGMAHQYYKLALGKNFLSGRRSEHVAVACLYLVCRKNKTDHLLIDFSDSTQTNVYNLGRVFTQLIQLLQEHKLPIIDPSLFIHRYVKRLELEDRMLKPITLTALRLVTRMKKDWIATGRRPDGVCAAALLIATRAHGVHRSQTDIAKLFRITSDTLRRRLQEFRESPAAQLSLEDFTSASETRFEQLNEGLTDMDPPAFTRGQRAVQDTVSESDEGSVRTASARRRAFAELYEDIYTELSKFKEEEEGRRQRPRRAEVSDTAADSLHPDDELEECILNEDEQNVRVNVWESEYRAVLDAREAQRKVREAEEQAKSSRLTKTGKKRKVNERRDLPRESARKAVEDVLTQTSRKINYEAFGESFREDGSFKTPEEVQRASVSLSSKAGVAGDEPGVLSTVLEEEGGDDDDAAGAEYAEDEEYDFDYYD